MSREHRVIKEGSPKVPAYIVTFSDMVTLLLTFFVMLLSLASVQDPELFNRGRGAFAQTIKDLGLGILYGKKQNLILAMLNRNISYSNLIGYLKAGL